MNTAETQITVNLSFAGLTTNAQAARIHGSANSLPGSNGVVLFTLVGTPPATTAAYGEQVFAITPAQLALLRSGRLYFTIGSETYPVEIRGQIQGVAPTVGLGHNLPNNEAGWSTIRDGHDGSLNHLNWQKVPWASFNANGGAVHPAVGDVDGDGFAETVVGLGVNGFGYIAIFDDAVHGNQFLTWLRVNWPDWTASAGAEVFVAVGNIDNDHGAEIVAGLGGSNSQGWIEIFDDAAAGYAHVAWKQVNWAAYNTNHPHSGVHPAIGDVDGDGRGEILLGLGFGGGGYVEVLDDRVFSFARLTWLQVHWSAYTQAANGATWPAAGDLDNDGRAEVVIGLGAGGQGFLEILDDATAGYASRRWIQVDWADFTGPATQGETHPAVGNIDRDNAAEIVIGLGNGGAGWFRSVDDTASGYAFRHWARTGWAAFEAGNGATFPALWVP